MGIPGLWSLMQHSEKFGKRCVLQSGGILKLPDGSQLAIGLLIDGFSLAHQLYKGLDWIHGGEYAQFAKSTTEFCQAMTLLGVSDIRVFMDGSFDATKMDTILSRRRKTVQVCKSMWAKLLSSTATTEPLPHQSSDGKNGNGDGDDRSSDRGDGGDVVAPLWMMSVFIKTLKENGVTVYFCDREADFDIVQFYSWAKATNNGNGNINTNPVSNANETTPTVASVDNKGSDVLSPPTERGETSEESVSTSTAAPTILTPDMPVTLSIATNNNKKKKNNDNNSDSDNNDKEKKKSRNVPFQWVVLAQDSDYCAYPDLDHYLPISEFNWESALPRPSAGAKRKKIAINCLLYGAESTANGLGIARKYLPVFATLVGNDNTSHLVDDSSLHSSLFPSNRGAPRRLDLMNKMAALIKLNFATPQKAALANKPADFHQVTRQLLSGKMKGWTNEERDKIIKQLVRAQQLYIQPKTLPRCCNDNTFSPEKVQAKWVISWDGNLNIAEVTPSDKATKITLFYRIFLYDPEPSSPFNLLRPIREKIISMVLKDRVKADSHKVFAEYFLDYEEPFIRIGELIDDHQTDDNACFLSFLESRTPELVRLFESAISSQRANEASKYFAQEELWRVLFVCSALRALLVLYWNWANDPQNFEQEQEESDSPATSLKTPPIPQSTEADSMRLSLPYEKSLLFGRTDIEAVLLHSLFYCGGTSEKSRHYCSTAEIGFLQKREVQLGVLFQSSLYHVEMVNQLLRSHPHLNQPHLPQQFRIQDFFNGKAWCSVLREHRWRRKTQQQQPQQQQSDEQQQESKKSQKKKERFVSLSEEDEDKLRWLVDLVLEGLPEEYLIFINQVYDTKKKTRQTRRKKLQLLQRDESGGKDEVSIYSLPTSNSLTAINNIFSRLNMKVLN